MSSSCTLQHSRPFMHALGLCAAVMYATQMPAWAGCVVFETQKIYEQGAGSGIASLDFGASVGVSGDHAIVGYPAFEEPNFDLRGRAQILTLVAGTWSITSTLPLPVGAGGEFGASVDIDGNVAIAGAPLDDAAGPGIAG